VESPIHQFLYKFLVCEGGGESTHYIPETKQKSFPKKTNKKVKEKMMDQPIPQTEHTIN
jgi:hypothetical protein